MIDKEMVNHPDHYSFGENNVYEVIKVIDAYNLNFYLGNTLKYIVRAGRKNPATLIEDLKKAKFYLEYEIGRIERNQKTKN